MLYTIILENIILISQKEKKQLKIKDLNQAASENTLSEAGTNSIK